MIYIVKHDFRKFRPTHWANTDYERKFGKHNEGFKVDSTDENQLREILVHIYNLNPFYLEWSVQA